MKTVRIPDTGSLWVCYINGARYAYEGGTTQAVPDEVAALIDGSDGAYPPASEATEEPFKPAPPDGLVTQDDLEPYAKTEDLEEYAEKAGTYPRLRAGYADNLYDVNATPVERAFTFDTTAGTNSIDESADNAEITSLFGKTIFWNQLIKSPNFESLSDWTTTNLSSVSVSTAGRLSGRVDGSKVTVSQPSADAVHGHKYLMRCVAFLSGNNVGDSTMGIYFGDGNSASEKQVGTAVAGSSTETVLSGIATSSSWRYLSGSNPLTPKFIVTGALSGTLVYLQKFQVFDLTQMFGFSNEPTEAEFNKLFPLEVYDYDTGRAINFKGEGLKTVGFNLVAPRGGAASAYAELVGGQEYEIVGNHGVVVDPNNKSVNLTNEKFTAKLTGRYAIKSTDTNTCLHLTWSGYRNGQTAPYWGNTLNLPIATMKDINGNVIFPEGMMSARGAYDELIIENGYVTKAVKRIGQVPLKDLEYTVRSALRFSAEVPGFKSESQNIASMKLLFDSGTSNEYTMTANGTAILPMKLGYDSADELVEYVGDDILYFELAEPVTYKLAEPFPAAYKVEDFGTEQLLPVNGPAPFTTQMTAKVLYRNNFTRQIATMPKNYESQDSMDELTEMLGEALGGAIVKTWDSAAGKYTYTFTPTPNPEET